MMIFSVSCLNQRILTTLNVKVKCSISAIGDSQVKLDILFMINWEQQVLVTGNSYLFYFHLVKEVCRWPSAGIHL